MIGVAMGTALIFFFIGGDLLLAYRYHLRSAAVDGTLRSAALALAGRGVMMVGLLGGLSLIWKKYRPSSSLIFFILAGAFGNSLAQTTLQSLAPYHTGYNYGATGVRETAAFLKNTLTSERRVIAPSEIIYLLNRPDFPHISDRLWNNKIRMSAVLSDPKTGALVYSIATNTIEQVRLLETDPVIHPLLTRHFQPLQIGTFHLWLRERTPHPTPLPR